MAKLIVICYFLMTEEWYHLVKIFCKPNLFTVQQEIILIDTNAQLGYQVRKLTDECNLNTVGQFLAVGAMVHKADAVELKGPEAALDKIVEDFWKESKSLHANQNIKLEVRRTNE